MVDKFMRIRFVLKAYLVCNFDHRKLKIFLICEHLEEMIRCFWGHHV